MLTVYLARHGQTDWNANQRLQGWTDIELNARGREQAKSLASKMAGIELGAIYTSTLCRARTTAQTLSGSASIFEVEGLRERCMGGFEGVYLDGREPEREREFKRRKHLSGDSLEGGESIEEFRQRVFSCVDEIVAAHRDGAILIVGHGATNSMIVGRFLQLPLTDIAQLWFANDDLYRIESINGDRGRVWKEIGTPVNLRFWRE